MSARGRKLTALTPRKANSRKIVGRRSVLSEHKNECRKLYAVIDLRLSDWGPTGPWTAGNSVRRPPVSTALGYALSRKGQLQISRFTPPRDTARAVKRWGIAS